MFAFVIMRVHASPEVGHDLVNSAAVHQQIVGMIRQGDAVAAADFMRHRIDAFRQDTVGLLARQGEKLAPHKAGHPRNEGNLER